MNDRDTALTRALIDYANKVVQLKDSFSGRVEATTEAREQILAIFETEAE